MSSCTAWFPVAATFLRVLLCTYSMCVCVHVTFVVIEAIYFATLAVNLFPVLPSAYFCVLGTDVTRSSENILKELQWQNLSDPSNTSSELHMKRSALSVRDTSRNWPFYLSIIDIDRYTVSSNGKSSAVWGSSDWIKTHTRILLR